MYDVQLIDWEDVLPATDDVNLISDSFHSTISEIIEKHVPLRRPSKRQVRLLAKPWITNGISRDAGTINGQGGQVVSKGHLYR